jgi:hypothetical protein
MDTRFAAAILAAWALCAPPASAWDEQQALDFIKAHNPVLKSYRDVGKKYRPPAKTLDRMLEYTSLYGRAGAGGTDYLDNPLTLQAGVQISIPLSSTMEQREFALKAQEEIRAIDQLKSRVLADIAKLREHEADLAAVQRRITFYSDKSEWLQQRVKDGLAEVTELWDIGQKLNDERATSDKLIILVDSQRYQLAHYSGEQWPRLLAYLTDDVPLADATVSQVK